MLTVLAARKPSGCFIPPALYSRIDLSLHARALLVEIAGLDDPDQGCYASNEYLGHFLARNRTTVPVYLRELVAAGLIVRHIEGKSRSLRVTPAGRELLPRRAVKAIADKSESKPPRQEAPKKKREPLPTIAATTREKAQDAKRQLIADAIDLVPPDNSLRKPWARWVAYRQSKGLGLSSIEGWQAHLAEVRGIAAKGFCPATSLEQSILLEKRYLEKCKAGRGVGSGGAPDWARHAR